MLRLFSFNIHLQVKIFKTKTPIVLHTTNDMTLFIVNFEEKMQTLNRNPGLYGYNPLKVQ